MLCVHSLRTRCILEKLCLSSRVRLWHWSCRKRSSSRCCCRLKKVNRMSIRLNHYLISLCVVWSHPNHHLIRRLWAPFLRNHPLHEWQESIKLQFCQFESNLKTSTWVIPTLNFELFIDDKNIQKQNRLNHLSTRVDSSNWDGRSQQLSQFSENEEKNWEWELILHWETPTRQKQLLSQFFRRAIAYSSRVVGIMWENIKINRENESMPGRWDISVGMYKHIRCVWHLIVKNNWQTWIFG